MPPAYIAYRESLVLGTASPTLDDGQVLPVRNVIWCTGFDNQPAWIDLPVFGADGEPEQFRGVAANEPGLYFLGREFMYALSSVMIQGAGRDAEYVARQIDTDSRTASVGSPGRKCSAVSSPGGSSDAESTGGRTCPCRAGELLIGVAGDVASSVDRLLPRQTRCQVAWAAR